MDRFAKRLLAWYDRAGRHDLPWQRDATPYHVWLSEIMLQQTQVATVIPYYERFVAAFPSLEALAAAEEDAVLRLWSGLGYYARARNLQRTARQLVDQHGGQFPADIDSLQQLPGIGRSTAGAILSSALGGRAPILDGNVKRVLARFHTVEGWPGRSAVAARLWELAELHTPHRRVADYTQAIMDLGATVCRRSRPACADCPLATDCEARALGRQADFPGRKPPRSLPTRRAVFVMAYTPDGELLLERRPAQGIWGGLWSFPEAEDEAGAHDYCTFVLGAAVREARPLAPLRHSFSHYHLEISPLLLTLARTPTTLREGGDLRGWPLASLPEAGVAAPIRRLWTHAQDALASPQGELTL
jgi:A/G-specific adenine glycosylase